MFNALFVIIGAALWATDTLFRHPMVQQVSPLTIVFIEHVFVTAISGVWLLIFHRKDWKLGFWQMFGAMLIGSFGSAIASLFFTASFQYVNPTVSILLQKIQPILVILLSVVFLRERITYKFVVWSAVALIAAFFMSFPSGISAVGIQGSNRTGVVLALSAAGFWAISTIIGKAMLKKAAPGVLSFWRFFFGLLTTAVFVSMQRQSQIELPFLYAEGSILKSIFFMALIPGFVAVGLYYRGLAKVQASTATILELSFPFAAMWINSRFLDVHLSNIQLMASVALLVAMVGVSRAQK